MSTLASIPSPSENGFHVGPLFFHAYGICYVFAVAAAILIGRRRWAAQGGDPDIAYLAAQWGFPCGLVGGRIYFDITTPAKIPPHWWGVFAIWDGGLGIWGGIAAGVAGGLYGLRRHGMGWSELRRFWDAATPGLPVAQGIGRIGNYFNQELFGKPTTLPWGLRIAPQYRPARYASDATFQPTFLYELIWDMLLAGFLVWLARRRNIRPPGLFCLYVSGYSAFRIFEETLRVDYSNYILGMRLNFWIALIGTLGGLVAFVIIQRRGRRGSASEDPPARSTTVYSRPGAR